MEDHEKKVETLKDLTATQCTKGNYDQNEYMRGMANGMLLAVSVFTGEDPPYFDAPPCCGECKQYLYAGNCVNKNCAIYRA